MFVSVSVHYNLVIEWAEEDVKKFKGTFLVNNIIIVVNSRSDL